MNFWKKKIASNTIWKEKMLPAIHFWKKINNLSLWLTHSAQMHFNIIYRNAMTWAEINWNHIFLRECQIAMKTCQKIYSLTSMKTETIHKPFDRIKM